MIDFKRTALAFAVALGLSFALVGVAQADSFAPGAAVSGDFVIGPTTPGKWGPAAFGTGATVTWSFMGSSLATDGGASTDFSSFMPAGFAAEVTAAFAQWSAISGLSFSQVPDPGVDMALGGAVDIRITGHAFDGPSGVLAHAFFPPSNGGAAAGDIHFDVAEAWKIGFGGVGFDIEQVMAHEIGHAIGLGHTNVAGSLMNPFYSEAISGVQADDIAGAVFIYGAVGPAVPEPGSIALLGLGIIGIGIIRRRRTAA